MRPTIREPEQFSFFDLPRALWYFLDQERWQYLGFLVVLVCALSYTMVPPYMVGLMANFLIAYVKADPATQPAISSFVWMVAILAGGHVLVSMVRLSSKRVLGRISLNARYRAKVWGFERLLDSSLAWHQTESTGNKAQRILTGAESVREWTGDVLNNLFPAIVSFIGSLIACLFLHPAFILFFVYYLSVLMGTELYFDYRIARLSDRINKSMENASGSFVESASNILAVKAMGAAGGMTNTIAAREELARQLSYERLRLGNTKWMCFQLHNGICWGSYLLVIGYMVMHGQLSPGFFLTYAVYFDKLRDSSVDFTDRLQLMIERKSNLARMMPLFWSDNSLSKGEQKFPTDWRKIELVDAFFRYGDKPAVGPLSLEVLRGQIVGIAGHSGSGKSTLIKLLLGLYHIEAGALKIGGVPINAIRHEELTANIAVVLQETEMFNFSLKENITMTREVTPALLQRACQIACLDDLIARLPEGLDTVVGERGYSLSGGERQRIGIARAICRNAQIMLLDEATSALDSATEQTVMQGLIAEYGAGRTMIIVAHRISTLKEADKILVFERGQLIEQGGFQQLAHDPSTRFGAMYAIQQA
ncbi:ABC transporter ATP-binding protein [Uliginosibacterium sediminicola]|uniref:ABC transporter ATP-binding protein n=1 Tax=Uliginosibacterium sediminicola TaxID=2024550 RepID=A0ABU9YXE7_9RHOO